MELGVGGVGLGGERQYAARGIGGLDRVEGSWGKH
jgi:hypothetical protein